MTDENENSEGQNLEVADSEPAAAAEGAQEPTAQKNASDSADNGGDGTEKLLAEFRELEKNYKGLREKLAATERPKPVTVDDLAEEFQDIENEDDKKTAERFVEILSKAGVDKRAAKDLLKSMGDLYPPEDPKEFYQKEMEKLGKDGGKLIDELRQFSAAMKEQSDWTPEDLATLEAVTQTADGVRLMSKVLKSAERVKAGQFSAYAPAKEKVDDLSNRDRIAMYERAYAKERTHPEEARQELNRLARLFEK